MTQEAAENADPFEHPDAMRRFRAMKNVAELVQALDYPWEKWTVFLHPDQRKIVEKAYTGSVRVSGSAGTGKTIVALHRAVFLARSNPGARILLATFSRPLANALKTKLRRLISSEPRLGEQLEVHNLDSIGQRLYRLHCDTLCLAQEDLIRQLVGQAAQETAGHTHNLRFLLSEWHTVVDAWQIKDRQAYLDVKRLGRKTRLPEKQRRILWEVFSKVRNGLKEHEVVTHADMFGQLLEKFQNPNSSPFDFIVVDEAQDVSVPQLAFLAALGKGRPDALFFAGDLGQRIFQQPFSWKALGVDIRGRSRTLRINYRTSHQIRMQADLLLASELSDVDGNIEQRQGTVSVFNGPVPTMQVHTDEKEEMLAISSWLQEVSGNVGEPDSLPCGEIGVFVRSEAELSRARTAVEKSGLPFRVLDENIEPISSHVSVSTMHLAKGLEFRIVVVMACDDEIIPQQDRIETVADETELDDVYNSERHLLYVACTRARDQLLVSGVRPVSEFVDDLMMQC